MVLLCIVKKTAAILIFIFLLAFDIFSNNDPHQSKIISGKIMDKQTGELLTGAKIQLKGADTFCYTDMDGAFILVLNASEKMEVTINMPGYQPLILKTNQIFSNSEIVLSPL